MYPLLDLGSTSSTWTIARATTVSTVPVVGNRIEVKYD